MHIYSNMFGYANAGWGQPSMQTGGAVQPSAGGGCGGDGFADGAAAAGGGAQGNPILQALAQALESLGLSLSTSTGSGTAAADPTAGSSGAATTAASTATTAASTATTAASTATTATTSATSGAAPASTTTAAWDGAPANFYEVHTIAHDIRHVMRALFMDVQAENLLAPASTGTSAASPQSSFGSGLAALIGQVQAGSVPANLQNAFGQLVSDLTQINGASGASGAPVTQDDSASGSAASTAAAQPAASQASSASSTAAATVAPGAAATSSASSTATATAGGVSYQGLLLQFLTTLQSDLGLGYGASSSAPAQGATSGTVVNTLA